MISESASPSKGPGPIELAQSCARHVFGPELYKETGRERGT